MSQYILMSAAPKGIQYFNMFLFRMQRMRAMPLKYGMPSIHLSSCSVENHMWSKYAKKAKDNGQVLFLQFLLAIWYIFYVVLLCVICVVCVIYAAFFEY